MYTNRVTFTFQDKYEVGKFVKLQYPYYYDRGYEFVLYVKSGYKLPLYSIVDGMGYNYTLQYREMVKILEFVSGDYGCWAKVEVTDPIADYERDNPIGFIPIYKHVEDFYIAAYR